MMNIDIKNATSRLIFLRPELLRRLSTSASATVEAVEAEAGGRAVTRNATDGARKRLINRISAIGASGGKVSVADAIHHHIREGNVANKNDLLRCLKVLRKHKRYQDCLEILQWMEKGRFNYSVKDYALRLDIISKVKGVAEAEKYFDSLESDVKGLHTFGALLNCYCKETMADKATALFEEMKTKNLATHLAYNNILTLCLKIGQPERVPLLVQEMREKSLTLDSHAYNILLQSYARMDDLEAVEKVAEELQKDGKASDWTVFSNLGHIYIKAGLAGKAEAALGQLEEILKRSDSTNRLSYHYLISLYSSTGDKAAVTRVWDALKSKLPLCYNLSYLCFLQALSKVDDIGGLTKYYEEWKGSYKHYDPRITNVVIFAYLKHNMVSEAESLFQERSAKGGKSFRSHSIFITHYLDKGEVCAALAHMEAAVAKVNKDQKFRLEPEQIDAFFKYFEEQKDVDGAENFFTMLKKISSPDSKAFLQLLQVYAAAGKTAVGMRKRMQDYSVEISSEHENMLESLCADQTEEN